MRRSTEPTGLPASELATSRIRSSSVTGKDNVCDGIPARNGRERAARQRAMTTVKKEPFDCRRKARFAKHLLKIVDKMTATKFCDAPTFRFARRLEEDVTADKA